MSNRINLKFLLLLSLSLCTACYIANVNAANNLNNQEHSITDELMQMSLEELMDVKISVPAAITKLALGETPAAITTITAKDIQLSPARNIYDLLETYVPGAIWMNHEQGPHLGMRGIIATRNYKFLMLVNGRLMNSKAHDGAKTELEQWDLTDIRKIEIIRGPGSVTYGPGAVAGIIKITTYSPGSFEGHKAGIKYVNKYDSRSANYSYSQNTEGYKVFGHASVTRTKGYAAPQFQGTNNGNAGYVGSEILVGSEPLDYFADYQDNPQIKMHIGYDFLNHWSAWLRYTQQGSTWRGNEVKSDFNGELLNQQSVRDRQITAVAEYKNKFSQNLNFSAMVSVDSFDTERRGGDVRDPDPDNIQNFRLNFSEDEIFLRALLNWTSGGDKEFAVGAEFSHERFGPGWGDNERDMILGDDGEIVNGPDSNVISATALDPADAIYAGDGWSTNTYSLFGEANLTLNSTNKVLLSARLDKNTQSNYLFSPRVAMITKLSRSQLFKTILQQSKRMNAAGENFVEDKYNSDPQEETLTSLEFSYTDKISDDLHMNLLNFWNDTEVIAWNNDLERSILVGELKLVGIEAELFYKWKKGNFGINYSYVKQLDWNLNDDLESSSISYSDVNQPLRNSSAVMLGEGNDLNNWPNQAVKLFMRYHFNPKTIWHIDAHLFWDYQGAKDGLDALQHAVDGQPEEASVDQAIRRIKEVDTYDYDFRLNTSIAYSPVDKLDIRFLIQNLLGSNRNKRYSYDFGTTRASPHMVRFVEEPRTFGIYAEYKF